MIQTKVHDQYIDDKVIYNQSQTVELVTAGELLMQELRGNGGELSEAAKRFEGALREVEGPECEAVRPAPYPSHCSCCGQKKPKPKPRFRSIDVSLLQEQVDLLQARYGGSWIPMMVMDAIREVCDMQKRPVLKKGWFK